MNLHSQQARNLIAWILGIAAFSPMAFFFQPSKSQGALALVTGRVTYSGRPLTGASICLDADNGELSALGTVESDGSFRLLNLHGRVGASPGLYHAYVRTQRGGASLPAKFSDPHTSGLEIEIDSGPNELNIDLH